MYNLFITDEARNDLREIRKYISVDLDNAKSAASIVGNIVRKMGQLRDFPEIGTPLSALINTKTDYRYLVCGSYNVFYRVETNAVKIIRVLHARRNFMAILFRKD